MDITSNSLKTCGTKPAAARRHELAVLFRDKPKLHRNNGRICRHLGRPSERIHLSLWHTERREAFERRNRQASWRAVRLTTTEADIWWSRMWFWCWSSRNRFEFKGKFETNSSRILPKYDQLLTKFDKAYQHMTQSYTFNHI